MQTLIFALSRKESEEQKRDQSENCRLFSFSSKVGMAEEQDYL